MAGLNSKASEDDVAPFSFLKMPPELQMRVIELYILDGGRDARIKDIITPVEFNRRYVDSSPPTWQVSGPSTCSITNKQSAPTAVSRGLHDIYEDLASKHAVYRFKVNVESLESIRQAAAEKIYKVSQVRRLRLAVEIDSDLTDTYTLNPRLLDKIQDLERLILDFTAVSSVEVIFWVNANPARSRTETKVLLQELLWNFSRRLRPVLGKMAQHVATAFIEGSTMCNIDGRETRCILGQTAGLEHKRKTGIWRVSRYASPMPYRTTPWPQELLEMPRVCLDYRGNAARV